MLRTVKAMLLGGMLVGALLVAGSPASAAPTPAQEVGGASYTTVPAPSALADYNYPCFGYTGNFKSGSGIIIVDWDQNGTDDECFGIAPTRSIYHAWPGSGGWKVMPNNGKADDTYTAFFLNGHRTVSVWVASNGHLYCSTLNPTWQPWFICG